MTSDTIEHADGPERGHDLEHPHEHAHPSDWTYIKVALFLAAVTAIEVVLYYRELPSFNNLALIVLSSIKFVTVVGFFMHLKFDHPILRRFFAVGFVGAVALYTAALITFAWIDVF